MVKAIDEDLFYRVPSDNRDLNYLNIITKEKKFLIFYIDYNSHNTRQLSVPENKEKTFKVRFD